MMARSMVAGAMVLALTGCGGGRPYPNGLERGETLLSVSGTGRAEARPDQAIFTAGLENVGANAAAASTRANEAVARIVAALKPLGIEEKDIQTSSLSISRIDYGRDRGKFQASNQVTVKVRKVDQAGAAIAAATQAGANVLSGPNLSVADPEAAALSAHGAAYRAARAKADAYAKAAGLKVVRAVSIADGGEGRAMQSMQMEQYSDMAMARAAPPPPVAAPVLAGTNSQTVSVRVDFALAP
ncbi:SIMPL domain-containing protein [Sphingomonas sp.]|uniref:SIMPL domain-containing protein n=1 Tax=Sphingomonas sp. TaxID=28214 RepID=UPI003B00CD18